LSFTKFVNEYPTSDFDLFSIIFGRRFPKSKTWALEIKWAKVSWFEEDVLVYAPKSIILPCKTI